MPRKAIALQRQGELGPWPSLRGQEAAQVGAAHALAEQDMVFPTYREHGVAWCRGLDPVSLLGLFRGSTLGDWNPYERRFNLYTLVIGAQTLHGVGYATGLVRLRDTVAARREFRDLRVTPLLFVARALLLALHNTPEANASWDEPAQEIVLKHYVNLGIAAATGRGLIVPNIKHADRMSLRELAEALAALTSTARDGRTTPPSMMDGTITITNVGVFGVNTGTPILNPGEAAVLAVGAIRRTPWVVTDASGTEKIEPRWVTQPALSFDHRLVDGQQGSQLLADLAAFLHDPGLAML